MRFLAVMDSAGLWSRLRAELVEDARKWAAWGSRAQSSATSALASVLCAWASCVCAVCWRWLGEFGVLAAVACDAAL